jgi:2-polyprenyl-6-methoxyphenol hydroxylase-like FAD-dependent oxidoreductase
MTLREMLIDSLPKDLIRWGHHLNKIDEVDGMLSLHFRDQSVKRGYDLVVGADGAWSHVRTLLSDTKPYYSGVSGFSLSISDPQERVPDVYAIVNHGSMFAFGDGKSIMGQQLGTGHIGVSTWSVKPSEWIQQFDNENDDPGFIKRTILEEHKGWAPELIKFVEVSDGPAIPRNLYMLPVGHKWKNRPGATLLGDAAHLMTPFAGEGVNLAMTDAMHLASAISKAAELGNTEALNQEIKLFEEDMFSRATKFQQMTVDMMEAALMEPGAPDSNIESYILKAAGHDTNPVVYGLLGVVVYTYFFFWRRWNRVGVSGWLW